MPDGLTPDGREHVFEEGPAPHEGDGFLHPGDVVLTLIDVGCLGCLEPTLIRGVYSPGPDAGAGFLRECERLEIPRDHRQYREPDWDEFRRAGGSFEVAGATYASVDHGGDRRLVLMAGVFLG